VNFYAHSTSRADKPDLQQLDVHLSFVGRMAAERAEWFGASSMEQAAGLLHDLGKCTERFQKRLEGEVPRMDHATWGAVVARQRYPSLGPLMADAIAGHHAGLAMVSACETGMWFDGGHCKVLIRRVR